MTTLRDYLANLNSAETQWSVYVNPKNLDDFRIGQNCFENGGINDDKVCIGSLDELSFGFQSEWDILRCLIENDSITFRGVTFSKNNTNIEGFSNAYFDKKLATELQAIVKNQVEDIYEQWALDATDLKIKELEEYFAEGGEYWQELKELELAYA